MSKRYTASNGDVKNLSDTPSGGKGVVLKSDLLQNFSGLTSDDQNDTYSDDLSDDGGTNVPVCPVCGEKCSKCMDDMGGNLDMAGKTYQHKAARIGAKTMAAAVQPVESDNPNGEFQLILSKDNTDRDGDNLWADQWMHPLPPKIHMDSDHAWARHESVPMTVGSGAPSIDSDGNMIVKGVYAGTPHAQMTRQLVNEGHIWQASVSYMDHELPDGSIVRELLNGTFTGVPANPEAVVLASKGMEMSKTVQTKDGDDMGDEDMADAEHKKTGGTTEGQYPAGEGPFGDPKNRKWPLNNRSHILNAWARIHQSQATVNYSAAEVSEIKGRIQSAARRAGITLSSPKALAALVDGLNQLVKMKDILAPWVMTQSAPGHTVAGDDVGAVSVYDHTEGEDGDSGTADAAGDLGETESSGDGGEDDNVLEWGDVHQSLAQACHDMACTIRDAALALGAQAKPDISTTDTPSDDWEDQGWGDKAMADGQYNIVITGEGAEQRFYLQHGKDIIAKGLLKDLPITYVQTKSNPGMPTGPYQGVEGMSGENASGTTPGGSIEPGDLFLQGTAGPAIVPSSKTLPSSTDEEAAVAADSKSAAAAATTPADVARASARMRKFKFDKAILEMEASR
jgi:hypothetical protein